MKSKDKQTNLQKPDKIVKKIAENEIPVIPCYVWKRC